MKKHIVVIGGGHGTSALTAHLKNRRDVRLTAIVAVTDMGGSTEVIRDNYEILALGDIRTVIESLIPNSEKELAEACAYRIKSRNGVGFMDGHPLGNIELLMTIKAFNGDVVRGIKAVMRKYRAKHTVLPVTADNVHLEAWFDDGTILEREGAIDGRLKRNPLDRRKIVAVYLRPVATMLREAQMAIFSADTIVVCAGSPFTSIGACFSVLGIAKAICYNTRAKFVQVMSLMTNANESPGWKASHHAENVFRAILRPFDCVVCNDPKLISKEVLCAYAKERARPVEIDDERLQCFAKELVVGDFADERRTPIRHNAKLASLIASL